MSKEYSKSLITELRKIAEDYSTDISTYPNIGDYSPEKATLLISEKKESVKKKTLSQLDTKHAKIRLQINEVRDSINKAKFPLLTSSVESDKLRGEQQQTNAMLIFSNQFLNGNVDGVLIALNQALESKRYDFATSLIEQIKDFPAKNDSQILANEKGSDLAANYFKDRGVNNLNEEIDILNYGNELSEISKALVDKGTDFIYLPEYKSDDYNDKIILEQIRMDSGLSKEAPVSEVSSSNSGE